MPLKFWVVAMTLLKLIQCIFWLNPLTSLQIHLSGVKDPCDSFPTIYVIERGTEVI